MINGSTKDLAPEPGRSLDPSAWADSEPAPLRDPRALVSDLFRIHAPSPAVPVLAVAAVLDAEGRLVGSASFAPRAGADDGWEFRNALLAHLRRIVPHGLRRAHPGYTAALMLCRPGEPGWTEQDGPWMWALRDSCALHGLRCGAYLTLNQDGWHVLLDGRSGRSPRLGTRPQDAVRTVRALPEPDLRPAAEHPAGQAGAREAEPYLATRRAAAWGV
ncbi:hypothetical protein [Phaeacidiphilus oryzae]|uniref:hypothetical protein n=1 Tax=Phaeacidiphilus oryzae TaxID=348818 RepID=UPI00068ADCBF|nr:hypothetical protein [Phaeacidiphilus oryzae]